jgi:hypothetical protein
VALTYLRRCHFTARDSLDEELERDGEILLRQAVGLMVELVEEIEFVRSEMLSSGGRPKPGGIQETRERVVSLFNFHGLTESGDRVPSRIPGSRFQPTDIRMIKSSLFGELRLRKPSGRSMLR